MHGRDHNEGPLAHCLQDWLHQPVEVELDLLQGQDQVALHVEAPMFVLVGLFFYRRLSCIWKTTAAGRSPSTDVLT